MVRAVLSGSGFDLAWFSSVSSQRLFIFGLYGAIYFLLRSLLPRDAYA